MKKPRTITYTYRSVSGIDISTTETIDEGMTRKAMINKIESDFFQSSTPLTKLDGKKIDIMAFLDNEIIKCQAEVCLANAYVTRLQKEKQRRAKRK